MTQKKISQLVGGDGKPAADAVSSPGWFIKDNGKKIFGIPPEHWAPPFAPERSGNSVKFYVTGENYFDDVAKAFSNANESIFITGWQVNFDVEVSGGKTLYEILEARLDACPTLRIYVMPWLSPQAGVFTGDFETTLAVLHLNSGLKETPRAFALPAIAQSDMEKFLGTGFSHHQKCVVIDQKRAFVGGIDLAYGRRDNEKFSLSHGARKGNELYNPCVPALGSLKSEEKKNYLTKGELLAAAVEAYTAEIAKKVDAIAGPPMDAVRARTSRALEYGGAMAGKAADFWNTSELVPDFIREAADAPIDAAQDASNWAYRNLSSNTRKLIDNLSSSGGANAVGPSAALVAWLNGGSLTNLPPNFRSDTITLIQAFIIKTLGLVLAATSKRSKRYANLKIARKMLPPDGVFLAADQPRMPWHDVHSSIEGPAVQDLASNFIRRWNGIVQRYEKSGQPYDLSTDAKLLLRAARLDDIKIKKFPRLKMGEVAPISGSCWVQVLRSAPLQMQKDEEAALPHSAKKVGSSKAQNNCLKAMLGVIQGAQKFIYIEGQFFQSAYGKDLTADSAPSGPMAALTDLRASPDYKRHAQTLGIYGEPLSRVPTSIRWSKVDNVVSDVKGGGPQFMNDLKEVVKSLGVIKTSKLLGDAQANLLNPIGKALARRIEAAIYDDLPFHVYMVLPVHPEGTLNTLNIMTQVHLTMQSLLFGEHSLVNRIRRAIASMQIMRKEKIPLSQAKDRVRKLALKKVIELAPEDWKGYLTLLNLRNWESLNSRPVTEQIYVHSKLLIADDRVAILGSANINDRSQIGDRDSELAVIIRDDAKARVKLDGVTEDVVSRSVHDLRVALWRKLFGLSGGKRPATGLSDIIMYPASTKAIDAIQRVAESNLAEYSKCFRFLPKDSSKKCSIWPTWSDAKQGLSFHMPFSSRFWRPKESSPGSMYGWDALKCAPENEPNGIQGYIVSLPLRWTEGENNISGMNLTLLANVEIKDSQGVMLASSQEQNIPNNVPV